MRSERKKQIMTLSILVVAILVISVGFAAFSTTLRINSSATVNPNSSDFSVKFSTTKDTLTVAAVVATAKTEGITATDGVINNSKSPTISKLSAEFINPGDYVEYTFYARNEGEYQAYLNNINFVGEKSCTPGEGATASLVTAACEGIKMTVSVAGTTYEGTTPITGHTLAKNTGEEIKVRIEYSSSVALADGPFTVTLPQITMIYSTADEQVEQIPEQNVPLYTGEIYRYSTEELFIGNYINTENRWCAVVPEVANSCIQNDFFEIAFNSKIECEAYLEELANSGELNETMQSLLANAVCEQGTLSYEKNLANISQNRYLKHEVVNNIITASYACITYTEDEIRKDVCLRGGDSLYYELNRTTLRNVESYFNTLSYVSSSTGKGYCRFDDPYPSCNSDSLFLFTNNKGDVYSSNSSVTCGVYSTGSSSCHVYDEY